MIDYACQTCGAELTADDADAGAPTRCPDCRARFTIPVASPPPIRPSRYRDDEEDDRPRRRRRQRDEYDDEPEECKKVPAGVFALLLGGLGVHKFYLGYSAAGGIMLAVWLASAFTGLFCILPFLGCLVINVIALVEGIIYLTKTDREFIRTYQRGRREWF